MTAVVMACQSYRKELIGGGINRNQQSESKIQEPGDLKGEYCHVFSGAASPLYSPAWQKL
jgi:hypothetical protein